MRVVNFSLSKQIKELSVAKKTLQESKTKGIAGLGDNLVTLTDQTTGTVVARVQIAIPKSDNTPGLNGSISEIGKIHFPSVVDLDQLEAVLEFCQKKKFNKLVKNGDLQQAQEFANRKF